VLRLSGPRVREALHLHCRRPAWNGWIFPWCFTAELYAERPEYLDSLAAFVRSRPPQSVPDFIQQSNAVLAHDVEAHLGRITAPTQITFGRHDQLTSTRCAERLKDGIRTSEILIFEACSHAPLYENVAEFNQRRWRSSSVTQRT
jgi:pimeloyl-ACP methyl ester carboxylesterase